MAIEERDDAAHRVVLRAKGMESKGKGAANAAVTSWLEPGEGTTTVKMIADIQLTGAVAQLSRGLLPEVSRKLTQQFADCLQENMLGAEASPAVGAASGSAASGSAASEPGASAANSPSTPPRAAAPVKAKPIGGLSLGLAALWARDREPVPPPLRLATVVISAIVLAAGSGTRFGGPEADRRGPRQATRATRDRRRDRSRGR